MRIGSFSWLFVVLFPGFVSAQVTLENPTPGQTLTGIGLLSGWACNAETASVRFDGASQDIPILIGSSREDTRSTCGAADTGFVLLMNWNILGAGDHRLTLFVNGQARVSRTITVVTYGEEFLEGLDKEWIIPDWPKQGTDTRIAWRETKQNIEIVGIDQPILPSGNSSLEALLGRWMFQSPPIGRQHFFTMTDIDPDPEDPHVLGVLEYANSGVRVYGETNTTRWFSQPLKQYEIYWRDGTQCHLYAFDAPSSGNSYTGYYWYGFGTEWEECLRDAHGPYFAVGVRQ